MAQQNNEQWKNHGGGTDEVVSGHGPDRYNLGGGKDTLIYKGQFSDFRFGFDSNGDFTVTDSREPKLNQGPTPSKMSSNYRSARSFTN